MRRAVIVREALGPLHQLAPVFTGAGFAKPMEMDSAERLVSVVRDTGADLIVVPLVGTSPALLDEIETLVRAREGLAVIGTAPTADPNILAGFRRGFAEFVVSPADPKELSAAFERLEARWERAPRGGHVTAIYSPAGGAGVSTIAVNLAHAIARRKPAGRVAVADLVVGLGDVTTQLNLAPAYDLGELVRKLDRADGEALQNIMVGALDGLDVLAGTNDLELGEDVTAEVVQRIMALMRSAYSYTVLDVEHTVSPRTIAALDGADRIVVAFQVTVGALRKVKRALALFDQLDFGTDKMLLVANRVGTADVMPWPDVAKALGRPVDFRLPNAYQAVADSQTRGVPVTANAGAPGAAQLIEAYNALALRIMGQIDDTTSSSSAVSANGKAGLGRLFGKLRK